jgi:hypothetical protein
MWCLALLVVLTPLFAYSLTLLVSQRSCFVLPSWREIVSLNPWEGVCNIVDSSLFQFAEEAIGTELNIMAHEGCIHTHEVERKRFANEAFFDLDGTGCWLTISLPDVTWLDRARRFEYVNVEDTGRQSHIGLDLVHFQRSTRDPHCILSCLTAYLRCGRERENCLVNVLSHQADLDFLATMILFNTVYFLI